MAGFISCLPLIIPAALFCFAMVKDELDKEKIFKEYEVLVWDEQDYCYVVRDRKTQQQYRLESTLFGYKFNDTNLDWSDIRYRKERIPGTRRYDTTIG